MFYKEEQLKELLKLTQPDHISILYLRLLLNITPGNDDLRLELIGNYINLGQDGNARSELERLLAEKGPKFLDARLLMLEIDFKDYFSITADDLSRDVVLAKLQDSIAEISKNPIPLALYAKVIQLSLELNQPTIAADLYYQWSTINLTLSERFEKLQESAKWYFASGLPNRAAEIYNECYELSENTVQARKFAILALEALQATTDSELTPEYLRTYQQRFPDDPEILDAAINIALINNHPKHAYELGNKRLAFDPDNPDQIKKQIDRSLAIGETLSALSLTQKLIEVTPDDHNSRESLARIAEWTNNPRLAIKEWLWLARNRRDDVAILSTIRLSRGLDLFGITIEMLEQLSNMRELSSEEMSSLLYAYDNYK
ncbi:hypothetical protein SAMN05216334_1533 [Nitrosomonas ureae]|uniref:Tetratricopeptide repeat-containing protein n=2 Tax=Nitrosomonas ureae TaxID=44577 RepID=A0A1H5YFV2_9PROT|nr:hypothetical protein SAMN05216334_1533 [Nitrosomonas ureae]